MDIDHFKQVNDRFGHAAGDAVLVELAALLRAAVRSDDAAVRLGGEEFAVLLPWATLETAAQVCERLRAGIENHRRWPQLPDGHVVAVSIGLAATAAGDLPDWLQAADAALYTAKRAGRNRVELAGQAPSGAGTGLRPPSA
jgi:diguanylate cyclase